jgi:glycosyltransferase involved in cell wall biosynthesis
MKHVLWWGRFDPDYSRNRILRGLLLDLGWRVSDFHPALSQFGDVEATLRGQTRPDLVWVPCFRQRDLAAALRWSRRYGVRLLADPLISAYDKQVDERSKLKADSLRARRLMAWESGLLRRADIVLADTAAHANYFEHQLGVAADRLHVVPVGAEEAIFRPAPQRLFGDRPLELLFFGSYIPLQGPRVIVEAARRYIGAPVRWYLVGNGPLRQECEAAAKGLKNVVFEDWIPYQTLPARIHQADLVLGIFGATPKAGRVIPNKAYQALACGRPLITRSAQAYPDDLVRAADSGILWVPPDDPDALAKTVAELAIAPAKLIGLAAQAARTYSVLFSNRRISAALGAVLNAASH